MAEVQTNTNTGQMAQRFIEFVMMQAQNAALFLGQIPNPQTGKGEVNLEVAKMFIDQLEMIHEKTRGNLSGEEAQVLRNTLSNLQMAYVEVAEHVKQGGGAAPPPDEPTPTPPMETRSTSTPEQTPPVASTEVEGESKKKFTKSYGS